MANILKAVVTADVRLFQRGMRRTEIAAARAAKVSKTEFAEMQNSLDAVAVSGQMVTMVYLAIAAAVVALIKKTIDLDKAAINAAKKYESLGLAFRFAAREGEDISKEFEELVKFADQTPFDTEKLIKYSTKLKNVTDGLFGTTDQIKQMSGALAKAQVLGKDEQFVNSLGQIINAFQIGGGRLKLYVRTLQSTGAISIDTAKAIMDLSDAGGSAHDVIRLLTKEFQKSKMAAYQFSQTAEGLESTLRSVKELTLGQLGGGDGLENYKLILKEIISIFEGIRETDAFKKLSAQLGDLNAEVWDFVRSDDFKERILDMITLLTAAARVLQGLVILFRAFNKIGKYTPMGLIMPSFSNPLMASKTSEEITKWRAANDKAEAERIKNIVKNTGITANEMNPEKGAVE